MNDEILDQELSERLDGELAPERVDALDRQIASDPALAARLAEFANVNESLRGLAPPALPSDLRARLQARIDLESPAVAPRSTAPGRGLHWGARVAAALAAGLVAAWLWWPNSKVDEGRMAFDAESLPTIETEPVQALEEASDDELAIAFELETLRDLELIRELDLLEALLDLEGAQPPENAEKERG